MTQLPPTYPPKSKPLSSSLLTGVLTAILVACVCFILIYLDYRLRKNEEDRNLYTAAEIVRSRLQQALQYSLSATQVMELTINEQGIPVNFDSVAYRVLRQNKYIDALQLAPQGVIRYVYPLEPNRAVLGYDVLSDSTRNKEALKALALRQLFFAGPFELKQGGLGVVGRLPVFIQNKFWGFSAVVIQMGTLLQAAGIDTTGKSGYYYQLSKINPDTQKEEFFLPRMNNSKSAYDVSVPVPDGEWKLSIAPANSFRPWQPTLLLGILALGLSVVGGIFAFYGARAPERLRQLVAQRTEALDKSEKRNKAIVEAIPDLLLVIDKDNRFTDYSNPMGHHTLMPPHHFIGKTIAEVMPERLVDEILTNKKKVLEEQQQLSHRYHLEKNGQTRYYEARYTPQGKEDILVLIRDITDTQLAQQRISESEHKYRTLVEQASDAIFIANFKGEFQVVNPAATRISQFTEQELLQMRIHELTIQQQLQAMPFRLEEIAAGNTATSERKLKRKDGSIIDVEIAAKIIAPDRFLAFVRDISERKKVEAALMQSREDLRRLSNHIENIREQERLHISREIHDELGQHLTVLKMDVSRLAKKLDPSEKVLHNEIEHILGSINSMVMVVRRISTALRPGLLDDLGLIAAIDWFCQDFEKRTGIQTSFISGVQEEELPKDWNIGIFRILQESLTNIARHAGATRADVSLVKQDDQLILLVEDNGQGLDPQIVENQKTLGIMGMKERAIMMGGSYSLQSSPAHGTLAELVLPLPAATR